MKALRFLGIFMFALRWHQAESVVRFVAAELFFFFFFFFKSGTIRFGSTSGQGERFHPAGDVLWVFVEPGNVVP